MIGMSNAEDKTMPNTEDAKRGVALWPVVVLRGPELQRAREALCNCVQLLRGWHADGTEWSEWDTSVEQGVLALQQQLEVPAGRWQDKLTDDEWITLYRLISIFKEAAEARSPQHNAWDDRRRAPDSAQPNGA